MNEFSFWREDTALFTELPHYPDTTDWAFNNIPDPWWERYQYELYDWSDSAWNRRNQGPRAWKPMLLTQGYFMAVRLVHFDKMLKCQDGTSKSFYAKVQLNELDEITSVYGARSGRRRYGEVSEVQAHREVMDIVEYGLGGDVDHINHEGLDNRFDEDDPGNSNLIYCPKRSENGHNAIRQRTANSPLQEYRGVELKKNGRYGGIRCVRMKRSGKGSIRVIRSKDKSGNPLDWATPEPARQWYLDEIAKLYKKRTRWAHDPSSVSYLDLPPLKPHAAAAQTLKSAQELEFEIPF